MNTTFPDLAVAGVVHVSLAGKYQQAQPAVFRQLKIGETSDTDVHAFAARLFFS